MFKNQSVYNEPMDTSGYISSIDRFRTPEETDQHWKYRRAFIEAFINDYHEERLICLSQCYIKMKFHGFKYPESLESLLKTLSDKLDNITSGRSAFERNSISNRKDIDSTDYFDSLMMPSSNFVSFSAKVENDPDNYASTSTTSRCSLIYESADLKTSRLRAFAKNLQRIAAETRNLSENEQNDRAVEDIYQIGTQHHLFIDYRPENSNESGRSHKMLSSSFLPQTFYGKLYIDDVYISAGHGTNKKICKRHCFQIALNRFLYEDFEVKTSPGKDGQQFYELVGQQKRSDEPRTTVDYDVAVFSSNNDMNAARGTINFVRAKDASTTVERTIRLQGEYSKPRGRGRPLPSQMETVQRSFLPPDPVPHQLMEISSTAIIEPSSTTPQNIARILNEIEQSAEQQRRDRHNQTSVYPFARRSDAMNVPESSAITQIQTTIKAEPMIDDKLTNTINRTDDNKKWTKLHKIQTFLFSLLNSLPDPSHSIDLISTQINKYQLKAEFECSDKPTPTGFHGHLLIEEIEIADGYGINKKLTKKQTYTHALKYISPSKSFSLELRDEQRWFLICHEDNSGILKIPNSFLTSDRQIEDRSDRLRSNIAASVVTNSSTSAIRHYYNETIHTNNKKDSDHPNSMSGVCIPPPSSFKPELTREQIKENRTRSSCSDEETIRHNIRRLISNTFVVFEPLDFNENIPGHYASTLFTSMAKNKLDLKYELNSVPNGFMVTFTIDDRFFMSWVGATKTAAKQAGAKKAVEILQTIYPSIKAKSITNDSNDDDHEIKGFNRKIITRTQLYNFESNRLTPTQSETSLPRKEDLGMKLLKKMGWTGGGIGKDLQGIAEPIQIEDLQGRKGLGSSNLYPSQSFLRNLRNILEKFISENVNDSELVFSTEFSSEERRAIHREAMKLHLTSTTYGPEGQRRIHVTQKRNVDQLVDHLLTNGGKSARYELKTRNLPKPLMDDRNQEFSKESDPVQLQSPRNPPSDDETF